jgi:large subunit ribosomal protein L15
MSDILSRLTPPPGSRRKSKRVGRGPGSGLGKTSGRGEKGQKARAGGGVGRGFEGGQMPAQRRMPKRGFTNPFRKEFAVVNIGRLEIFDDGAIVDPEALLAKGIIKNLDNEVKILGNGELSKKLTIRAHAASGGARAKIENVGSVFEEIPSRL